jgi:proteic killer suppression protein
VIKSFASKETEKIFNREFSRKLPQDIQRIAMRKLWMLHAAKALRELLIPPSNQLEALSGDRKGQHSIRINQQWRICFKWVKGGVEGVEIVDYH